MRKIHTKLILVGSLLVAGLGVAGAATANDTPTSEPSGTTAPVAVDHPESGVNVEHQRGIVLEGAGVIGGRDVTVTVYENSLHTNTIQVVVGDPDDGLIGFVEQEQSFVINGVLEASVEIDGQTSDLKGTVEETGRAKKVTEPVQDAGEQIISKGTHTQLLVDVNLSFDGDSAKLAFAPAFAYDLEIRKVALYGR
jgi:hypothetical protein